MKETVQKTAGGSERFKDLLAYPYFDKRMLKSDTGIRHKKGE
jgi:hypothetical protein